MSRSVLGANNGLAAASLRHCDPAALRATLAAAALMRGLGEREDELAPLGWWTTIVRIPCAEGLPRHRRMPGGGFMFARHNHVAICSEHYALTGRFYDA